MGHVSAIDLWPMKARGIIALVKSNLSAQNRLNKFGKSAKRDSAACFCFQNRPYKCATRKPVLANAALGTDHALGGFY